MSWVLWLAAVFLTLGSVGATLPPLAWETVGPSAPVTFLAWQAEVSTQIAYGLATGILVLLYPTGTLPSARWRIAAALIVSMIAITASTVAFMPGPLAEGYPIENPLGLAAFGDASDAINLLQGVAIVVTLPACILSQVARYRHGTPVVRQQIKWFAAIGIILVTAIALATVAPADALSNGLWGIATVGIALLPVAIGVAILRYRLYDLDRIVSRTIAWAIITGALLLVFGGAIIALQAVLSGLTQGQTLAVAGSTLLAFALFQPLRTRVQRLVDRRFNRAGLDAEAASRELATRLRDEVDLDALDSDLRGAIDRTVAPQSVRMWLRPRTDEARAPVTVAGRRS